MVFSWCSVWHLFLTFPQTSVSRSEGPDSRMWKGREAEAEAEAEAPATALQNGRQQPRVCAWRSRFGMMDSNLCFIHLTWQQSVRCRRAARSSVSVSGRVSVLNGFSFHLHTLFAFFKVTVWKNNAKQVRLFFFILAKVGNFDFQIKDMQTSFFLKKTGVSRKERWGEHCVYLKKILSRFYYI